MRVGDTQYRRLLLAGRSGWCGRLPAPAPAPDGGSRAAVDGSRSAGGPGVGASRPPDGGPAISSQGPSPVRRVAVCEGQGCRANAARGAAIGPTNDKARDRWRPPPPPPPAGRRRAVGGHSRTVAATEVTVPDQGGSGPDHNHMGQC